MGKITNQELDTTLVTKLSNSDSHIANISNPHSVTASQVGAEPANANIQTHISSTSNPHSVTATQIGLGNVTNESKATMFTSPTFTGTVALNGGQIKFPATQVPSADANTLDDYEEGTWTPILATDGTNPTGVLYSNQVGKYTKNGNVVTAYGSIYFTTYTGGTGNIGIGNLPFIGGSAIGVVLSEYITFPESKTQVDIIMISGTSFVMLEFLQPGGTYTPHALTSAAPSNATVKRIFFSFSYFTT